MKENPSKLSSQTISYYSWPNRYLFAPMAFIFALCIVGGMGQMVLQAMQADWSIWRALLFVISFLFLGALVFGALKLAYPLFNSGIVARLDGIEIISLENSFKKHHIEWNKVDRFDSVPLPTGIPAPAMVLRDGTIFRLPLSNSGYFRDVSDTEAEAKMMTRLNQMLDQIQPSSQTASQGQQLKAQSIPSSETYSKSSIENYKQSTRPEAWLMSLIKGRRSTVYIRSEGRDKETKANSIQLSKPTKLLISVTGFILLIAILATVFSPDNS